MVLWRAKTLLSRLAVAGMLCLMLAIVAGAQGTPTGTIAGYIREGTTHA